jgi:hypothetical protein
VPVNTNVELIAYASSRTKLDGRLVGDLLALAKTGGASGVDGMKLYPDYLAAVESLWRFVDGWRSA